MRVLQNKMLNRIAVFEVFTAVTLNISVFWDLMPCYLVDRFFHSEHEDNRLTDTSYWYEISLNRRHHISEYYKNLTFISQYISVLINKNTS
jgi:hypothetical protein